MADTEFLHAVKWSKKIVPKYYSVDRILLPIRRRQTRLVKIECELLGDRKNRGQCAADLRGRVDLPIEPLATDVEAESSIVVPVIARANEKGHCPPVEDDVRDWMPEPFGCLDELGQVLERKRELVEQCNVQSLEKRGPEPSNEASQIGSHAPKYERPQRGKRRHR
jgi:hypothetical protein